MQLPKRKPNRLKDFDYSQNGLYFITICTNQRQQVLWEPSAYQTSKLSFCGVVVDTAIAQIHSCYPDIMVDKYTVMPNHVHMILQSTGQGTHKISVVVNQMKGYVTKQIGRSLWQKSYHDHVIRSEKEYQKIWQYIDTNPQKWQEDCFFHEGM